MTPKHEIMDALKIMQPVYCSDLADKLDIPWSHTNDALAELERQGKARQTDSGQWVAV